MVVDLANFNCAPVLEQQWRKCRVYRVKPSQREAQSPRFQTDVHETFRDCRRPSGVVQELGTVLRNNDVQIYSQ